MDTVVVLVDFLYNDFDDPVAIHDIIWSDGPSSESKNKFMVKFLQSLSQRYKKTFFMEILYYKPWDRTY